MLGHGGRLVVHTMDRVDRVDSIFAVKKETAEGDSAAVGVIGV